MPNRYAFRPNLRKWLKIKVAEGVRFELTRPFGLPVFKTGAINRSATPPAIGDQESVRKYSRNSKICSTAIYVHMNLVCAGEQKVQAPDRRDAAEPRDDSGARRILEPSEPIRKTANRFNRRRRSRCRLRDQRDTAASDAVFS